MIVFSELRKERAVEVSALWNEAVTAQGQGYEQHTLTESRLQAIMDDPNFLPSGAILAEQEGELVGFALGYVQTVDFRGEGGIEAKPGRFAGLAVKPARWRKGIGRALLSEVEKVLARQGKSAISFETYRMPVQLVRVFHLDTGPYRFMVSCGYRPTDHALYLRNDLDDFVLPDAIKQRREQLAAEGIEIRWYEPQERADLLSFMKRCFPGGWYTTIEKATEPPRTAKVLIALAGGQIVGFIGPFWLPPDASGRAGFGSPGVDPEYRRRGIGAVIFNLALDHLKSSGAHFTEYGTGALNPARFMYFKSGAKLTAIGCSSFHKALVSASP
jgi:GNAT superfamily N-acetyltransferase